ncbi:MAG: tRNA-uridine 2-sulfurtransferase [Clostridiales bacterium]|jgi:tRNA-specific 2-thiouridylase|nr:tRNA-uridine 2-sulfurtransferase [Clostridiales bacterium]
MEKNNRVVVGMSGGVDSTVAAYLLKEAGYDVIGVNMRLWQDDYLEEAHFMKDGGCCSLSSVEDARRVCREIGIPFYALDFKTVFKETVVDYFIDAYHKGLTPNPCIACNKFVKFEALLEKAHALGAYYVATGHYAKIEQDKTTGRYVIRKADSDKKDQTYALYNLTQEQLAHILMPLGEMPSKDVVREIASRFDVRISEKSDSQEICFVPDQDYVGFLKRNSDVPIVEGIFVDSEGEVLGAHKGIEYYTIGQRKGLGVTFGKPMYVIDIDPNNNRVTLGEGDAVFEDTLYAGMLNWVSVASVESGFKCQAKVRYSATPADCTLYPEGNHVKVVFDKPQRAITPGQAVVFYQGDLLVGGGTIERHLNHV